ncbi:hypothetical protein ACHQM5_010461 [Ranunculus cassubicifolius]
MKQRKDHQCPYRFGDKEEEKDQNRSSSPVSSRVLYLLGDLTSGPAFRFAQWLDSVRSRSGRYQSSNFRNRQLSLDSTMPFSPEGKIINSTSSQILEPSEISLWERLSRASTLDTDSSEISWDMLSSLHRTEHSSSTDYSEDELNKALEVTVNSGGVVFFALFNISVDDSYPKEAAAVIKISSSRMATQSERLGYEFAKWLGVSTPQARVIHNSSDEWQLIKNAAEKTRDAAAMEGDDVGEVTCSELLEALELSRCLFLMNYVHGSPFLESISAFDSQEAAKKTSAELGRVLMLDLVIRNEDRLPCRQLGWRGNSANLLLADKLTSSEINLSEESFDSHSRRDIPRVMKALHKERRSSADGRFSVCNPEIISQSSDVSAFMDSPKSRNMYPKDSMGESKTGNYHIVAIDSCVPRRPPAGKRANDHVQYPKLVELLLNSVEYSASLLYDITGGKLGCPLQEEADGTSLSECTIVVNEFRGGFRAALRDLQGSHIFLLTLYQKLDNLLRVFLTIVNKNSSADSDKEDFGVPESPCRDAFGSPSSKDRHNNDSQADSSSDPELLKTAPRSSLLAYKETPDSASPVSRENWHGKFFKGSGEPLRCLRLTAKLRDFNKYAKVDAELSRELEQWNEALKSEAIKLCQENNFHTGFFEGSETNTVVDAYELKVRLEHILERIALISDAANTEKPSLIIGNLFIGGALAARSVYTLQHLGITHILCLCSNEIGQSDSQFPDLFVYKNFSIYDNEDTNISNLFEEASDFIDNVEKIGGKVLVHCFEGKSRSATVVLAYLMLRKKFTLLDAWNTLKRAHRRAQPNDGFAKTLLDLDMKLYGKVSMEWQHRKPTMRVCPICGKNAGLSSSSLKLHLQKSHRKLSSGSVDSAMTMEIQKVLTALKINRGGSVSP